MAEQPLDTLSAQLASAFVQLLTQLQQKINAAVAAGDMSAEAGQELTQMVVEASVVPRAVGASAKAQHAKSKRAADARRAGGRNRAAGAKRRVLERDAELLAAALELRKANPERSINSLAKRLAPRFARSESTIQKRLIALNFASPQKTGPRA